MIFVLCIHLYVTTKIICTIIFHTSKNNKCETMLISANPLSQFYPHNHSPNRGAGKLEITRIVDLDLSCS